MILYNANLFVYTESYLFSCNGRLYKTPPYFFMNDHPRMGKTIVDIMLQGHRLSIRRHRIGESTIAYMVSCGVGAHFMEVTLFDREIQVLTSKVYTLQRGVRAWLARKHAQRRLAVAMALNPRLGASSRLGELGEDLIRAYLIAR